MQTSDLANEWSLLQNQLDSYEKYSLLIKLTSIGVLSFAYFTHHLQFFVFILLLVLWVQDAIWKTFQSRIETRLLQLEGYLSGDQSLERTDGKAYQFNSLYIKSRPGTLALMKEYFRQAIRPTVAYPHAALLLLLGLKILF
ncbi:MAG: hypothetical protein QNK31_04285 [Porticoccus sp.]|nr:hypothetical protein [Porticoccus sp.]